MGSPCWTCQYCMLASEHQAGPTSDEGTPEAPVREPGIWVGFLGRQRDHAGTCGTRECTCAHAVR